MREYVVLYSEGPTSWGASVPDLPGCIAAAATRQEVEKLIREASEFHIEGMRLHGDAVPDPSIHVGTIAVAAQCR